MVILTSRTVTTENVTTDWMSVTKSWSSLGTASAIMYSANLSAGIQYIFIICLRSVHHLADTGTGIKEQCFPTRISFIDLSEI